MATATKGAGVRGVARLDRGVELEPRIITGSCFQLHGMSKTEYINIFVAKISEAANGTEQLPAPSMAAKTSHARTTDDRARLQQDDCIAACVGKYETMPTLFLRLKKRRIPLTESQPQAACLHFLRPCTRSARPTCHAPRYGRRGQRQDGGAVETGSLYKG